jgi:hypothetical protein
VWLQDGSRRVETWSDGLVILVLKTRAIIVSNCPVSCADARTSGDLESGIAKRRAQSQLCSQARSGFDRRSPALTVYRDSREGGMNITPQHVQTPVTPTRLVIMLRILRRGS